MEKWTELKQRFVGLHRFMCGVTFVCVAVTIAAGALAESSAYWITWNSALVLIVLGFIQQMVIRLWATWTMIRANSTME